jgi:hypothetical protein
MRLLAENFEGRELSGKEIQNFLKTFDKDF